MFWVVVLVLLALAFGIMGLLIEAVTWFLVIAGLLLVAGIVRGFLAGRSGAAR